MLGFLINEQEQREIAYVLKREMEEILLDLGDERIDRNVKEVMKERYKVLFQLFKRVSNEREWLRYMLK
jgi:DNA-binding transcriptional regulator GbsR (MarR family)